MSTNVDTLSDVTLNTRLVLQFVDEFWNRANATAADLFLSATYVDHTYQPANREGLVQTLTQLSISFPDHVQTIEAHVAQDDLVVLRMRLRATHLGDFRGTPPTGNPIDVPVYRMYRIASGQIAEHWGLLDTATLLRQIGTTPTPQNACAR
jgi:predicted ester cyclase